MLYYTLLIYHPKSELYNLPEEEKVKIIQGYDDTFSEDDPLYQEYKNMVLETLLTPSERSLRTIEKKLRDLNVFIDETPYTLENIKLINDSMIAMDKLTDTIKSIREKLAIESEINNSSLLEDMYG